MKRSHVIFIQKAFLMHVFELSLFPCVVFLTAIYIVLAKNTVVLLYLLLADVRNLYTE